MKTIKHNAKVFKIPIVELIIKQGLVSSRKEVFEKILLGQVKFNNIVVTDYTAVILYTTTDEGHFRPIETEQGKIILLTGV